LLALQQFTHTTKIDRLRTKWPPTSNALGFERHAITGSSH